MAQEGHSAVVHATALSLPGSRLVVADDATPKRLHIEMAHPERLPTFAAAAQRTAGGREAPAPASGQRGVLYTCKICEGGPDVPDPVSINVTSCLFRKHGYAYQPTLEAARKVHPCRYFDTPHLAAVCALLGDTGTRTGSYGWWCAEVEKHVRARGYAM